MEKEGYDGRGKEEEEEKKKKKKRSRRSRRNHSEVETDDRPTVDSSLTTTQLGRAQETSTSQTTNIDTRAIAEPRKTIRDQDEKRKKSKRKLEELRIDQRLSHEIPHVQQIKRQKIKGDPAAKSSISVLNDSLDRNGQQITPTMVSKDSRATTDLVPVSTPSKPSKKKSKTRQNESSSSSTTNQVPGGSYQQKSVPKSLPQESRKHDVLNLTRADESSNHQPIKSGCSTSSNQQPSKFLERTHHQAVPCDESEIMRCSSPSSITMLDGTTGTRTQDSLQRSRSKKPQKQVSMDQTLIHSGNCHLFKPDSCLSAAFQARLLNLTGRQILRSVWLSTSQLNELADIFGLRFKKGIYSKVEQETIDTIVQRYCKENCLAGSDFAQLSRTQSTRNSVTQGLIPMICEKLEGRPLVSVWQFIRRAYNPQSRAGRWTQEEEEALLEAYRKHGSHWTLISQAIGRSADDCKDRWRNHTRVKQTQKSGDWSKEEEDQLIQVMRKAKPDFLNSKDSEPDGLWTWVSEQMGGVRSRAQCRVKWVEFLRPRLQGGGQAPVWKNRDILILAQQLKKHNFQDELGFDWKQIRFEGWSAWGQSSLQRRWSSIKKHFLKKKLQKNDELGDLEINIREILDDVIERYRDKSDEYLDAPARYIKLSKRGSNKI